jgi:hypothetical protein
MKNKASGISSAVTSGAKTAWQGIKEHAPEVLGTALKGVEHLAPHLGPLGTAVSTASKALSPHLAKAIGGNFEKGYNLHRFGGGASESHSSDNSNSVSDHSAASSPLSHSGGISGHSLDSGGILSGISSHLGGISSKIAQGLTPGVKQAIPSKGLDPGYKAKITFR